MARRITIIQGHPDPSGRRLCHQLANSYAAGAVAARHAVKRIEVAMLDFPVLRSAEEFESGAVPDDVRSAQAAIRWAEHVVIIFPLWLGTVPALLEGFLEQTFRPGFGVEAKSNGWPRKLLAGRSARIIVTMGMPALVYRWYFGAHGLKSLEHNVLGFAGFRPVRRLLIGTVGTLEQAHRREYWLECVKTLGREGR
jgi:putative NADPH-quinone reductase